MLKYLVIVGALLYAKKVYAAKIEKTKQDSKIAALKKEAVLDSIN